MNRKAWIVATAGLVCATGVLLAQAPADGALARPTDLRELVFLTSGYGMAYGPAADLSKGHPPFTNVYVNREPYRRFQQSGVWPDGTQFFLEVREGLDHVSIDSTGRSQGRLLAIEGAMKDTRLFPDGGWAYYDFGAGGRERSAKPLPRTQDCYACHARHGAVEWTFTQFYPDQFAVAKAKGTVRNDYDPRIKAR